MTAAWRIARRELRGGLAGFWIFLSCLMLGVGAIAAVGTVRAAIETGLSRQGAVLLGGDAALRLTYRFATDPERAWIEDRAARVSEIVDFRSMAVAGDDREPGRLGVVAERAERLEPLDRVRPFRPRRVETLAGFGDRDLRLRGGLIQPG